MTQPPGLRFVAAASTDIGTVRTTNEDAALVAPHLLALADGMGGHAAGEVASAVTVASLTDVALAQDTDDADADALRAALARARGALRAMSAVDPELAGMGTTVVAVLATPSGPVLAHVGDSRIYRLRGGVLAQLTQDHTHVQRLVDAGRLEPHEVRTHPFRSVILRSLDDSSDDLPDIEATDAVAPGDRLLLCSDGLSDYVDHEVIAEALDGGTCEDAADRLVAAALAAATRDNVTVVVADVMEAPTPGAETQAAAEEAPAEAGWTTTPREVGANLASLTVSEPVRAAMEVALGMRGQMPPTQPENALAHEVALEDDGELEDVPIDVDPTVHEQGLDGENDGVGEGRPDEAHDTNEASELNQASDDVVPSPLENEDAQARVSASDLVWIALVLAAFVAAWVLVALTGE